MKKYRVDYSGFCYVYAEDEDKAEEKARDGDVMYSEEVWDDPEEIDEFVVEM